MSRRIATLAVGLLAVYAHNYLICAVAKGELGFSGFVVSGWQGTDRIDGQGGFTTAVVRTVTNAGIDMAIVPYDHRGLIASLRGEVQGGRVSVGRIDDTNRCMLTGNFQLGPFERPFADRHLLSTVHSVAHRAVAGEAVLDHEGSSCSMPSAKEPTCTSPSSGRTVAR